MSAGKHLNSVFIQDFGPHCHDLMILHPQRKDRSTAGSGARSVARLHRRHKQEDSRNPAINPGVKTVRIRVRG